MIVDPILHKWEYQEQEDAYGELYDRAPEQPPFHFICRYCGANAYLDKRFDSRSNSYIWPNDTGCERDLQVAHEVMTS